MVILHGGITNTIKYIIMSRRHYDDEEDYYSPTSWERDPDETDEEYQDRMQDQEDLLEYFDE
jgi:hypothetical protein